MAGLLRQLFDGSIECIDTKAYVAFLAYVIASFWSVWGSRYRDHGVQDSSTIRRRAV
jgi:hypothetical protein